jgi:RNA polymerase sigma factor (sigma-70 family)
VTVEGGSSDEGERITARRIRPSGDPDGARRRTDIVLAVNAPPESARVDDRLLVARMVAGDDAALAEVYDRLAPMVFGVARRVTADPIAAEDVCQEVFVQLWTNASAIDLERCSLRGWASVLAHRRAVDVVRRNERSRRREAKGTPSEPDCWVIDLAEGAVSDDRARRARLAVASLPEDQRLAIELAFWRGHSYRQVAEELGIPEGTAKSRMRLGLARLAALLEEDST